MHAISGIFHIMRLFGVLQPTEVFNAPLTLMSSLPHLRVVNVPLLRQYRDQCHTELTFIYIYIRSDDARRQQQLRFRCILVILI